MAEWFGVLITAAAVTCCYILTSIKKGNNADLYPVLAGFILCFYSADHLRDLRRYRRVFAVPEKFDRAYLLLFITGLVLVLTGFSALMTYPALWKHYLPAVLATQCYVMFRKRPGIGFIWLRTVLIAVAVAAVILPGTRFLHDAVHWWSGDALALLLACWVNVLAYGYYDLKKDRLADNHTMFTAMTDADATRLFGGLIAAVGLLEWWLMPLTVTFSGGLIYAGIIAVQFALRRVIPGWLHRWLPDMALPLVLYPFWQAAAHAFFPMLAASGLVHIGMPDLY